MAYTDNREPMPETPTGDSNLLIWIALAIAVVAVLILPVLGLFYFRMRSASVPYALPKMATGTVSGAPTHGSLVVGRRYRLLTDTRLLVDSEDFLDSEEEELDEEDIDELLKVSPVVTETDELAAVDAVTAKADAEKILAALDKKGSECYSFQPAGREILVLAEMTRDGIRWW